MGLLNTGPCNESAKYRRYAVLSVDDNRFVEVTESPYDPTKLILSVDGLVRTIVDGPFQYGYLLFLSLFIKIKCVYYAFSLT